ncbi:MAG TPA: DUF4870 domain-containing protein [bacterium]|nr:DUF4870 domain-containing protein [bacterium]
MSAPAGSDQSQRLLAALAYPIWIIALIIVLTDIKKDPFMRRHGWCGLFWAIAWAIVFFAWGIVASLPLLHWLFFFYPLLWPAFIVLSIYYAVQAYNGREVSIPFVSEWAQRYST